VDEQSELRKILVRLALAGGLAGLSTGATVRLVNELTASRPSAMDYVPKRILEVELPTAKKRKRKTEGVDSEGGPVAKTAGSITSSPYGPIAALTAVPAAVVGWSLTDRLLDRLRAKRMEREIERAKQEFIRALKIPDKDEEEEIDKKAAALDGELDAAYEALRKDFQKKASFGDWLNTAIAAWLAYAALSGTIGFQHGWKAQESRDPDLAAAKALSKWDFYRIPSTPLSARLKKPKTEEEEDEEA